nr:MAG TPA: hypothetical protein [Caudoviricetes sp.]
MDNGAAPSCVLFAYLNGVLSTLSLFFIRS